MDIEAEAIIWLNANFRVPAYSDVPEERPAEFLTVERTGGPSDQVSIDRPSVAVQCWAKTRADAAQLANDLDAVMRDFAQHPGVSRVSRTALYNFPTAQNEPRYQVTFDLVTYI